ncbi:hypothetical protein L6164_001505 [Bauhinia variegata]|uniref:Uncharacterized protein n=1 Tax=Bauhinia variegata TaxID=167791 RepID=A0ACB9Q9M2_BAUVA|nr:hypothetical protein L6164_001505 [Bauhinia variegata]
MSTVHGGDSAEPYNKAKAVKQFDESKRGVKGLVDSGIKVIPPFFVHPPETISDLKTRPDTDTQIPTVDLSGVDSPDRRATVVEQIRIASSTLGFFRIINHGIAQEVLDRTIKSMKAFHEQPAEIKALMYRRDMSTGVAFRSNIDLYHTQSASWRDTVQIRLGPTMPDHNEMPEICRDQLIEWNKEILRLGEILLGLLSEGLGLSTRKLTDMTCAETRILVGHYYPFCPQPDLTVGITSHTDPGVLTVLLQDHIGGLQVRSNKGWIDVQPVPGALVINIGDLLQIISNEKYMSSDHRVLANSCLDPRVSVAVFLNPNGEDKVFGPLPELISAEKPAAYRDFTLKEFLTKFFTKELGGKTLSAYFRH